MWESPFGPVCSSFEKRTLNPNHTRISFSNVNHLHTACDYWYIRLLTNIKWKAFYKLGIINNLLVTNRFLIVAERVLYVKGLSRNNTTCTVSEPSTDFNKLQCHFLSTVSSRDVIWKSKAHNKFRSDAHKTEIFTKKTTPHHKRERPFGGKWNRVSNACVHCKNSQLIGFLRVDWRDR